MRRQLRIDHLFVGGADDGNRVNRHDDVAVGGHFAAIEHSVDDPVVHRDHGALARDDLDDNTCLRSHLARPGAGCIDDHVGMDDHLFLGNQVAYLRADDTPPAVGVVGQQRDRPRDRRVRAHRPHARPARWHGWPESCRPHRRCTSKTRLHAWVEQRFAAQRFGHGDFCARQPKAVAGGLELIGVVALIFGRDHKEAAGLFDAMGVGAAQDAVLLNAFDRAARILDDVAATAVEQTVIASGRSVGQVALFDQDRA